VLAIAAVVVLAPPPPPIAHLPKREPVLFWHMWSGEWQPVVENICKRFNESQTRYEVIPLQVPAAGAETKFLLSAAGGTCPDLISQWNPVLGMWSDRKLIQPVEELMTPEEKARFMREAYPIIKKHAIYKGKIMALIAGVDVNAVYYRMDYLKEVGRDQNNLPQTLEELVELGKQLDRYDKDGKLVRVGFLPQGFQQYVPSFGGSFNDEQGMKFNTPEQLRALEFVVSQTKRIGYDRVTRFLSSQAADVGMTAPLIAGNYAIMLDGQWRVKQIAQFAPNLPYFVAPLPPPAGGKAMASRTDPNYMVIPRAARNPKGGLAFLKFWIGMDNPDYGAQNVVDMGWLPYCDKVANTKAYQAYLKQFPNYAPFVKLMASPNLETSPLGSLQSFAANQLNTTDESATRGTLAPKQALLQLQKNMQKEMERQKRLGHEL
jgi:multiple sugar transport system substrate-binding protein